MLIFLDMFQKIFKQLETNDLFVFAQFTIGNWLYLRLIMSHDKAGFVYLNSVQSYSFIYPSFFTHSDSSFFEP